MYKADPFPKLTTIAYRELKCDNEEYHNECDGVSNSMLGVFLDDPALFEGRYVSKRYPAPTPTADMEFGTIVHEVLLEDGLSRIVEIPRSVLAKNGARLGSEWHKFELDHPDKILLKREEIEPLREIRRNAEACPLVREILFDSRGANEKACQWLDGVTGLFLKARIDRWCHAIFGGASLLVDVKTCAANDPRSFAGACARWDYARQAAFYRRGVKALTGEAPPFVFIAVRKTPPYTVAAYDLSETFLAAGERRVADGLADLARRRDTGDWRPTTAGRILTLDAPHYYLNDEWEVD